MKKHILYTHHHENIQVSEQDFRNIQNILLGRTFFYKTDNKETINLSLIDLGGTFGIDNLLEIQSTQLKIINQ